MSEIERRAVELLNTITTELSVDEMDAFEIECALRALDEAVGDWMVCDE